MTTAGVLDFDVHGIVGIRTVDAQPREAAALRAQLGGMVGRLERAPDITVRFVRHSVPRDLRYVEVGRTAFSDDGYYLLSHRRRRVLVRMPFDSADSACEIVCAHGVGTVPFLPELVMLMAVRNGFAPVHASAFEYRGHAALVAGWAHGGKTSCLLAFAGKRTRFISDDLVLLRGDGSAMFGVPGTISVADWQLDQLPEQRGRAGVLRRSLLSGTRALARMEPRLGDGRAGRLLHAMLPGVQRRLKVGLDPEALFGDVGSGAAQPGTVFLTLSHASHDIHVEAVDPETIATQLTMLFRAQMHALMEHYSAYRFAFPDRYCDLVENAEADVGLLLRRALAGQRVFTVRHPHPVSFPALRRAMEPHLAAAGVQVAHE